MMGALPAVLEPLAATLQELDVSNYGISGLYFLCNKGKVVYVGRARNIMRRVAAHLDQRDSKRAGGKQFDQVFFLPLKKSYEIVKLAEGAYIDQLQAPYNGTKTSEKRKSCLITGLKLAGLPALPANDNEQKEAA